MSAKRVTQVVEQVSPTSAPIVVGTVPDANGAILEITPDPIVTPDPAVTPVTPDPVVIPPTMKSIQGKAAELATALTAYLERISTPPTDLESRIADKATAHEVYLKEYKAKRLAIITADAPDSDESLKALILERESKLAEFAKVREAVMGEWQATQFEATVKPVLWISGKGGKRSSATTSTREPFDLTGKAIKNTNTATRYYTLNGDSTLSVIDADSKTVLYTLTADQVNTLKLTSMTAYGRLHGNLLCPSSELPEFTFNPDKGSIGSRVDYCVTRFTAGKGWAKKNCNGVGGMELVTWPLVVATESDKAISE